MPVSFGLRAPSPAAVPAARAARATRPSRQRGAALLEMCIVVTLLAFLLFGIIAFGVTLSFRQTMGQAANEAARAAAVAPAAPATLAGDRAKAVVDRLMAAEGTGCDDGRGLSCSFVVASCAGDPTRRCMTVRLVYDLAGRPRVGSMPMIDATLPDTLVTTVVVEVNGP